MQAFFTEVRNGFTAVKEMRDELADLRRRTMSRELVHPQHLPSHAQHASQLALVPRATEAPADTQRHDGRIALIANGGGPTRPLQRDWDEAAAHVHTEPPHAEPGSAPVVTTGAADNAASLPAQRATSAADRAEAQAAGDQSRADAPARDAEVNVCERTGAGNARVRSATPVANGAAPTSEHVDAAVTTASDADLAPAKDVPQEPAPVSNQDAHARVVLHCEHKEYEVTREGDGIWLPDDEQPTSISSLPRVDFLGAPSSSEPSTAMMLLCQHTSSIALSPHGRMIRSEHAVHALLVCHRRCSVSASKFGHACPNH